MGYPDKLQDLAISETGFVFDPFTGASFNTNATGRTILMALKEGLGREEIRERLKDEFDIAQADVERDLAEFLFLLRDNGVLPADFDLEEI